MATVRESTIGRDDPPDVDDRKPHVGPWAVAAAIGLLVLARGAVSWGGYLTGDDFILRYLAATSPLSLDYLFMDYSGHVSPVGMATQWLLQHVFPASHSAMAVYVALVQCATLAVAALVAHRLTRSWLGSLVMVTVLGLSVFGLEASLWWAAALYAAPYTFFLTLASYCLVVAIMTGKRHWRIAVAASYAGALLSFSRGSLAIVLLVGVAVSLPVAGPRPLGVRGAWRWSPRLWILLTAMAVGHVGFLAIHVDSASRAGLSAGRLLTYGLDLWRLNIAPAVFGGPWRWWQILPEQWRPIAVLPAPGETAAWLSLAGLLVAVLVVARYRRHLLPFLGWVAVFAMGITVVAGIARAGTSVASVAFRYTFDLAWPLAILVVLVLFPMWWQESRPSVRHGVISGSILLLVCLSWVWSSVVPAQTWMQSDARDYVHRGVASLSRVPDGQVVLPQGVPPDLLNPVLTPRFANSAVVFTPIPGAPPFGDVAMDGLYGFAESGQVEEQELLGPTSEKGPVSRCGYAITSTVTPVPLDGDLIEWGFYARVVYFSGVDTTMNVAVGPEVTTIPITGGGLHSAYFRVSGPGSDVGLSINDPGRTVCVTEVTVGNRTHPGGGTVRLPPSVSN